MPVTIATPELDHDQEYLRIFGITLGCTLLILIPLILLGVLIFCLCKKKQNKSKPTFNSNISNTVPNLSLDLECYELGIPSSTSELKEQRKKLNQKLSQRASPGVTSGLIRSDSKVSRRPSHLLNTIVEMFGEESVGLTSDESGDEDVSLNDSSSSISNGISTNEIPSLET
ncbi:hypothetical protein [Carp edema virus]|nr:hypothetical protein [Carp edema virus]